MRLIALGCLVVVVSCSPASAQEVRVDAAPLGNAIDYAGRTPGGRPPGNGGGRPAPRQYRADYVTLVQDEDGVWCLETESRYYDTEEEADSAQQEADEKRNSVYRTFPACDPPEGSAATPEGYAVQFWGQVPLSHPNPRIQPGYAVTGKRAYLESGATMAESFRRETPFGVLTIDATGPYVVDWGDGTVTGPYTEPGLPWPGGTVTHTYTDAGTVDVVVTQNWTAEWHLGDDSGHLEGLHTDGRIDDLGIRQLQAVRNR